MSADSYVYLTLPPDEELRSCLGLVVAGMSARANVGVGGMEDFVDALEREQFEQDRTTRFRFLHHDKSIIAEVETTGDSRPGEWHLVAELVA